MTTVSDWLGEAGTVTSRRRLKDASPYEFLFPRPKGETITVKRNAGVKHTVQFIPKVVESTADQTEGIARMLIAPTLRQTCENIWHWVYDHIRYEKDETGKEQVRAPVRLFSDRKGDCDCFTTFIDSVMLNVSRIKRWPVKVINRITKYGGKSFQHIYPIVVTPGGERIVMDCVTEFFDYEEPYTEKEDHKVMDLEYLNGIDSEDLNGRLYDEEDEKQTSKPEAGYTFGELGKLKLFHRKKESDKPAASDTQSEAGKTKGGAIKKAVHAVNRVNPATLALRNGLLAAMKLNVLNVAGRLKWTYLNEDQAKKKGLNMERYAKAKKVRERLEKIFYGAGGAPENLRESILTGKGNKGKEVNGLGVVPLYAMNDKAMSLRDVIGAEIYDRENSGLSGLGVVTEAAMAAATAAVATLSQLLKKIGPVKDGETDSDSPDAAGDTVAPNEVPPNGSGANEKGAAPASNNDDTTSDDTNAKDNGDEVRFMDDPVAWAKANPVKATVAVVGVAALVYGGYKWFKGRSEKQEAERNPQTNYYRQSSRAPREDVYHVPLAD